MADRQHKHHVDLVTHYMRLIVEERENIRESYAKIAEYANQLRRVGEDVEQRLLPRD